MYQKLDRLKVKKSSTKDEDIESVDEADEVPHKESFLVGMQDEEMQDKETAEEKRLRMTKQIIQEYAVDSKTDFFATLQAKTSADQDIVRDDDDLLTRRMKMQMLE